MKYLSETFVIYGKKLVVSEEGYEWNGKMLSEARTTTLDVAAILLLRSSYAFGRLLSSILSVNVLWPEYERIGRFVCRHWVLIDE